MDMIDKDSLRGEFIGLYARLKGKKIEGKIIDETKNMFLIETKEGRKKVIKKNNSFELFINNRPVSVDGEMLVLRPEDRIKAKW